MPRSGSKSGFTLVELLLVMVVLATIAALATPALRGFTKSRLLPNTALDLVSTARFCQEQAKSEGVLYRLMLDPSGTSWTIMKDDGTGTNFQPIDSKIVPPTYTLPEGITLSSDLPAANGEVYIEFDPTGRSDMGTITLESERVTVRVTSDTPRSGYHIVKEVTQ
jgi:general secretion pathway protein H